MNKLIVTYLRIILAFDNRRVGIYKYKNSSFFIKILQIKYFT